LSAVLLVGDVFHPLDDFPVEHLRDRDVRHRGYRRRAVPMPFAWPEPHDVTGANLFDRSAVPLHTSTTGRDDQRLPEWMCVPRRASAGFEGHGGTADARRCGSLKRGVDPHRSRKPVGGTYCRRL
jgi:hypothetical protein